MIYGDEPQQIGKYEDPLGTSRYVYAPQITAVMQAGNLYGYCVENPNMYSDPNGKWVHIAFGAFIGGVAGIVGSIISQKATTGKIDWIEVAISACTGAISGGLAATGVGLLGQIAGNALIGAGASLAEQLYNHNGDITKVNFTAIMIDTFVGAVSGFAGGKGGGSSHLDSSAKHLFKRIGNAKKYLSTGAIKACKKEIANAIKNYLKNTTKENIAIMYSVLRSCIPLMIEDGAELVDELFKEYDLA